MSNVAENEARFCDMPIVSIVFKYDLTYFISVERSSFVNIDEFVWLMMSENNL